MNVCHDQIINIRLWLGYGFLFNWAYLGFLLESLSFLLIKFSVFLNPYTTLSRNFLLWRNYMLSWKFWCLAELLPLPLFLLISLLLIWLRRLGFCIPFHQFIPLYSWTFAFAKKRCLSCFAPHSCFLLGLQILLLSSFTRLSLESGRFNLLVSKRVVLTTCIEIPLLFSIVWISDLRRYLFQ